MRLERVRGLPLHPPTLVNYSINLPIMIKIVPTTKSIKAFISIDNQSTLCFAFLDFFFFAFFIGITPSQQLYYSTQCVQSQAFFKIFCKIIKKNHCNLLIAVILYYFYHYGDYSSVPISVSKPFNSAVGIE